MPYITALTTALLAGETTDTVIASVTAIVAVLSILVSLINANGSASKQAFEQLKQVVESMEKDLAATKLELKETKDDLNKERRARVKYEKWARILDLLLTAHQIEHPSLDTVEIDDD